MDAQNQDFRAQAKLENGEETRHFARRIDCAHGYGRAPGEGV